VLLLLLLLCVPAGKPFAVLGFGSRSYPRFCAAADRMHTDMLAAVGASSSCCLMIPGKADAVVGEEAVVWPWLRQLTDIMQAQGWLTDSGAAGITSAIPAVDTKQVSNTLGSSNSC
jgi:hypothetical protein